MRAKRQVEGVQIHIPTRELDKLLKVSEKSNAIGAFLDWLQNERELTLCQSDRYDRFYPEHVSIEKLLAEYFEIDLDAVERERRAILKGIHAAHDAAGEQAGGAK